MQTQLEQAAKVDIRYFLLAYKACPTCGRKFDYMHPAENLYPHWIGNCKPEHPSNHTSVQRAVTGED